MGKTREDGAEYTAANGYSYRKVGGKWVAIHHIIAEEKLGRPIDKAIERVVFKDNDRNNLHPDNVLIVKKVNGKHQRREAIKKRIAALEEELKELED